MKRKSLIVGGLAVLVLLLVSAAFVGGRLLNQTAPSGSLVPGGAVAGGKPRMRIEVEPASELPTSAPDAIGPFVERKDNSLFVAFGSKFMILTNKDGSVQMDGMDRGQRLEVVVTTDTTLYKDVTGEQFARNAPLPADGRVQQKVEAGSLDEIGSNSFVSAWGERRGDRLIAKVLVYTPAQVIPAPDQ
jgi:hypothetical protein